MPITATPSAHEELTTAIVKAICRKTEKPRVVWSPDIDRIIIEVNPSDQGRIIGKGGVTFWAMEVLLWFVSLAHATKLRHVELIKHPNNRPGGKPFTINANWDRQVIGELIDAISNCCIRGRMKWWIEEGTKPGDATIFIEIEKNLERAMTDPSFEEAAGTIIHAAGLSDGATLATKVIWK